MAASLVVSGKTGWWSVQFSGMKSCLCSVSGVPLAYLPPTVGGWVVVLSSEPFTARLQVLIVSKEPFLFVTPPLCWNTLVLFRTRTRSFISGLFDDAVFTPLFVSSIPGDGLTAWKINSSWLCFSCTSLYSSLLLTLPQFNFIR